MAEMVQTVLGKINANDLGRTLTHEHMQLNYSNFYAEPRCDLKKHLEGKISLKNIGIVRHYPYSSRDNISFCGKDVEEAVLEDLKIFREFGGSALVENTSHGLQRNAGFFLEAAQKLGIHIIAGTGFYLADVQPDSVLSSSVESICDTIRTDLIKGCLEKPEVKCGIIGEVASNYPIHPFEKKSIQATGIVQEELKCPVTFHPGRDPKAPTEIMRIYTESGGDPRKAVMSHLDRTFQTLPDMLDFADEIKCFLQHDLFGMELLIYQFSPTCEMPSDLVRLQRIKALLEEGHLNRILMSQDVHTRHRLASFGGHGYFHLYANVIEKMKLLGLTSETIDQITISNPRNWLSWNPV